MSAQQGAPPTVDRPDPSQLPEGVRYRRLTLHADERGALAEIFRESWETGLRPVQWNLIESAPGVLRGVHVHPRHTDYIVILSGRLLVGLSDLRPSSPSFGRAALLPISGTAPAAVTIPAGVAHGFYAPERALLVYGASHPYDPEDEIAIRWSDPELGLGWPIDAPTLSPRDAGAPALAALRDLIGRRLEADGQA